MIDPNQLISKYPLAAEACDISASTTPITFACAVRGCAQSRHVGNAHFDSVAQLMQAIESHLSASRPKTMTEEDVRMMRWECGSSYEVGPIVETTFFAVNRKSGDAAVKAHNKTVDRLWSSVLAERAEVARLKKELEARR